MAKKVDPILAEIKQAVQSKVAVYGQETVVKRLQRGSITKVFLAKNCPIEIREIVSHRATLMQIPVIDVELDNEELGIVCKRNFFVTVMGVGTAET